MVYQIQTSETDIGSGSLVVTGGASAISKAAVISLIPAVTFTKTDQDAVYPPRVALAVGALLGDEFIEIYRSVAGVRTLIRGGEIENDSAGTGVVVIDAEFPFGVPITWVAIVNGAEYSIGPVTYDLPGGKVALSDAITGESAEVVITSWPDKNFERRTSQFQLANGDTVVRSGPPAMFTGRLELFTLTESSRANLKLLLDESTSNVIQIRQPGGYEDVDSYVAVLGYSQRRYSQDGTDERRIFSLDVAEVRGWGASMEAAGYTYADLDALYTGLTYADLDADFATYLALAVAELEP